jgi:hypothetical protein
MVQPIFFLINIKINFYVFNSSLFKNYVNKTKNILHIRKSKIVNIRSSPLYDVNLTII